MRNPIVAGRFYPDDPSKLKVFIEMSFTHPIGPGTPTGIGNAREIRGMMVPHAGYEFSGPVAAYAFKAMAEDGIPDVYVIIGPDHYGTARGCNVLSSEDFATPFGVCHSDADVCRALSREIPDIPSAHRFEHSIEVELPFIQYFDDSPSIVPIIMGDQSEESAAHLAGVLKDVLDGRDAVVVASSDMSHYIPRPEASRLDGLVMERIGACDIGGMYREIRDNGITMCGYGPVAAMMGYCDGCHPTDMIRADSFDGTDCDRDSVVGYGAAVFRV